MKKISPKLILALQLVVMLYTLSSVAAKMASGQSFLSLPFLIYYGVEILILGFYAIAWQQIIKRCDLSVAYANRSMAILWSLVWTVIFFHESLTVKWEMQRRVTGRIHRRHSDRRRNARSEGLCRSRIRRHRLHSGRGHRRIYYRYL